MIHLTTRSQDSSVRQSAEPTQKTSARVSEAPLFEGFNDTYIADADRSLTLHALIERQCRNIPDHAAVVCAGETLSYAALDRRARGIAGHLIRLGCKRGTIVGLHAKRSVDLIAAIFGILKAGAAYLPIDPHFPPERISFILKDAGVALLLTEAGPLSQMFKDNAQLAYLEQIGAASDTDPSTSYVGKPCDLAYLIYTSGSTGQPKGVCIEHGSIVNYTLGITHTLRLQRGMTYAMVSTIAADLGNTVLFPALATGGTLHLITEDMAESQVRLSEYFSREQVDVLKITPSHLAALQGSRDIAPVMPRRRLILGGEPSRAEWVRRLQRIAPACEIYIHYGPTETTVGVLTYRVGNSIPPTETQNVPLGRPLPNCRVYVLDAAGQVVPPGLVGELYIGGSCVGRGYLNRDRLTQERFVPDPFSRTPGARLYRTGDRARYLVDGDIEFCGRTDYQVKVRGYRVELGEVEVALRACPGVKEAIVLVRDNVDGDKDLAAYILPHRNRQPFWEAANTYVLPDGTSIAHLNKNETDYIYNEIFVLQSYLKHGITVNDADCIVDAGANIGLFTVFMTRLARSLRIIALEPNSAAFTCLAANAEAWGEGIRCLPFGLSDTDTTAEMVIFEGLSLLSGFHADPAAEGDVVNRYIMNQHAGQAFDEDFAGRVHDIIQDRLRSTRQMAQLRRLSTLFRDEKIDRVDLLKINVEKSELQVLNGIDSEDWQNIRQLVIEVDVEENVVPIADMLRSHGYDVLTEQDPLLKGTTLCYIYAIRRSLAGALTQGEASIARLTPFLPLVEVPLSPLGLRMHLTARLPQYMVPSAFFLLERLPLTDNGKVDREALRTLTTHKGAASVLNIRPRTEVETALAVIWSELLNAQDLGVDEDFFERGGHSLLAIRAASRIRDVFRIDLPAQELFTSPTIRSLAARIVSTQAADLAITTIEHRDQMGPCPLSFAQQRLWFLAQLAPDSPLYNMVDVLPLTGEYDGAALHLAITGLISRHSALRTVVQNHRGEPVQFLTPIRDFRIDEVDLAELPIEERNQRWDSLVQRLGSRTFDLSQGPLFRAGVVHKSSTEHELILAIHHIIADEWSMEILRDDFYRLYRAHANRTPCDLPALPIEYGDYARWQRHWMTGPTLEGQLSYWKTVMSGAPAVLDLPTDKPRPSLPTFEGATEVFSIPADVTAPMRALCSEEHATPFMALAASLWALLRFYTGQDDITLGTPISGRTRIETENIVGLFLNTVLLRGTFGTHSSFRDLLRQARERALGAYGHPDLPFDHLVAELSPARDVSRTPLFQVMLILHSPEGTSEISTVEGNHRLHTHTSKFDLTFVFSETCDGLEGMIEYSTDLFTADTIHRLIGYYLTLLKAAAADPDCPVGALNIIDPEESQLVLNEWNNTSVAFPDADSRLDELISKQALTTPHRDAVCFRGQVVTYAELVRRADCLACYLRSIGVRAGTIVGVHVERSIDMVVGILGILKAGGAYLPLDASFPEERLAYMMADSGLQIVVTTNGLSQRMTVRPAFVVQLDLEWSSIEAAAGSIVGEEIGPDGIAYVLYTSGSTGKPKGVPITHSAIVNFLLSMAQRPGFSEKDSLLAVTTLSFDIAGLELFLPLITGGKVIVCSREEARDATLLMKRLETSGCTVMQATPPTWRALIDSGWRGDKALRALCGGEALSSNLAAELLRRCGELWNLYGPTETTVWSTIHKVTSASGRVPIGRPIANTQVYVLNERHRPVPVGAVGELYIGGAGLASGYLNREDLTKERFLPSPFGVRALLYRTGDLARWRPDGVLECLGRADEQVKIRGFRVELGEIENALRQHPGIQDVAVTVHNGHRDEKRLIACVVLRREQHHSVAELRAYLRKSLPEYMVPTAWSFLQALPLTPNRKIDRKALPVPAITGSFDGSNSPAAVTETERTLTHIVEEILGAENVGVRDSFFELGGHSLLAIMLVNEIEITFGVRLSLEALFRSPTIVELSALIDKNRLSHMQSEASIDLDSIRKTIRTFIVENYLDGLGIVPGDDEPFERGIIDPLRLHEFLTFLDEVYGIPTDDGELTADNISSIESASNFVWQKLTYGVRSSFGASPLEPGGVPEARS